MESWKQECTVLIEFLNTLNLSGLLNHFLKLKVDLPVMLRNKNLGLGLCNGTILLVTHLGKYIIDGKIISGNKIGSKAIIPTIFISSSDPKFPFVMKRRQYPLRVCYANKSWGQSLKNVGVYLPKLVFNHGQLYIAMPRVTSPDGLKFLTKEDDINYKPET